MCTLPFLNLVRTIVPNRMTNSVNSDLLRTIVPNRMTNSVSPHLIRIYTAKNIGLVCRAERIKVTLFRYHFFDNIDEFLISPPSNQFLKGIYYNGQESHSF